MDKMSYDYKNYLFPENWEEYKLSQLLEVVERPVNMVDDQEYDLITIKRNFGGIESRGKFTGEKILVKSQFEIRERDFIISKRQIVHGACAVVPKKYEGATVSNEYDVMNCNNRLLPSFFDYYVQLPFMRRYFYIASDGVHVEKLRFKTDDWLRQRICVPSIIEQQNIASILATRDKAIRLIAQLIVEKKKQKKGLMQKLLTGKKRLPRFNGEWREAEYEDTLSTIPVKKHQINSLEYLENGKYPVADQGKQIVVAFSNNEKKLFSCPDNGVIIFGDHTRELKYIDFDFVVGADGTQVLTAINNNCTRFLYYQLGIKEIPNTGYNRHFKFIKEMSFLLPPSPNKPPSLKFYPQQTVKLDLHEKQLEELKKQKKAMMQMLLTGIVRVNAEEVI